MKLKVKMLTRFILILGLLTVPTSSVFAQSDDTDIVLFGENYTLKSGNELNNAIIVFGGNVIIEEDASVTGDIAVIGGNIIVEDDATITGDVIVVGGNLNLDGDSDGDLALIGGNITISSNTKGDIVIIGGQVTLTKTAYVDGDIATVGANVEQEEGSEITGKITNNEPPVITPPNAPNVPNPPDFNYDYGYGYDYGFSPFWQIGSAIAQALVIAAIAMLLMLFLQPQLERAGNAMTSQPFIAGGFGLLTLIIVPVAAFIIGLTILLIPVSLILVLLVPLAWLFGIIALGQEVGERFTKAINQTWAPVLSTGFGTFMLVLLTNLIGLIPCVGWLAATIVNLIALGGVAMTWFGTRNIVRTITSETPPAA